MFRIRRIHDAASPAAKQPILQAQALMRERIPDAPEREVLALAESLRDPFTRQLRGVLLIAEGPQGRLLGFALVLQALDLKFAYLDWLCAAHDSGGGIGSALYQRAREDARAAGAMGLFLESLPDDPAQIDDAQTLAEHRKRMIFYERHGARPIIKTAYETRLPEHPDDPAPMLLYDDLGRDTPLDGAQARPIVRAILERKYGALCPPEYVERVVASFADGPVQRRAPVEPAPAWRGARKLEPLPEERIALLINDQHDIHHVRERGYVESPVRIATILRELRECGLFEEREVKVAPDEAITAVHDPDMVAYIDTVCAQLPPGKSLYPYVFPLRHPDRKPQDLTVQAGYYCLDTFTPLHQNAPRAARGAVNCAVTGAELLRQGARLVYALVRPPGHHAERRTFGGFCYFNHAAIAAHQLSADGPVALLDIDYHHGNGQQDIFYERADVLTVSIHGHPHIAYPYFTGFEDERGEGEGEGFNVNLPLAQRITPAQYDEALQVALARVREHEPMALVLSLGLDTALRDPTGTWAQRSADFERVGRQISALGLPTLVIQEGGYDNRVLGVNARHFFRGLWLGMHRPAR